MEKTEIANAKKESVWGPVGSGIVPLALAVCCAAHLLLLLALGAVGLSAFTPYLDYVLFPALALLIVLTFISYRRWKTSST